MEDLKPVHEWFLHRGLPLVLTRRVRSRSLIERSAPLVGGLGALVAVLLLLAEITSGSWRPTHVAELGALAVVMAAAPTFAAVSVLAIWLTYLGIGSIV